MTPKTTIDPSVLCAAMEVLEEEGTGGMLRVFTLLMNEVMKIERQAALGAQPYERSEERRGHANGYKPKTLVTRMGETTVEVPQVRGMRFYPRSLERGSRSERSLKLAIAQMYIEGTSTRRVTEITEKLCGLEVSSTQVSRCAALLDAELEAFRTRPIKDAIPYVYLDARYEKVRHNNRVIDHAILIAIGVTAEGKRTVLGLSASLSEAEVHWRDFLQSLMKRGLHGVRLITSDQHSGLSAARKAVLPGIPWQRCQFHFQQNAQSYVPKRSMKEEIAGAVRSIFSADTLENARERVKKVVDQYQTTAPEFAKWLEENVEDCFQVLSEPVEFQKRLRTVNALENINREIKRRTRVAGIFPHKESVERLVSALLVEIDDQWIASDMPYLNMQILSQHSTKQPNVNFYRKKVA